MHRIGGSTYSRQPFRPQFEQLRDLGFDYAEIDLTWIRANPDDLGREAFGLGDVVPIETSHLAPPRYSKAHLDEFLGFVGALVPVGCRIFNVHLAESRFVPAVALDRKVAWIGEFVDAARESGATITLENLDEDVGTLRTVLDACPDLRFCLDIGHANLDGLTDRPYRMLDAFGSRLGLVHAHDNNGGHGEAGDLHLPFGRGKVDLPASFVAIQRTGYRGPVTLEIFQGTLEQKRESVRLARRFLH